MTLADIPPYPVCWPDMMPRTLAHQRKKSQFKTSLSDAIGNVATSLRRFGDDSGKPVSNTVATTNVGGIQLAERKDTDPGVAVWFDWDGQKRCIAVDRYPTAAENLQAIHHILEARRTEVRHGGIVIARTAFKGFLALPSPTKRAHWTETLGLPSTARADDIEQAYRSKAKLAHPDIAGGSAEKMTELNAARDAALSDIAA